MKVIGSAAPTLGDTLERVRLEHRAQRLEEVLRALDARRLYRERRDGDPPVALLDAVGTFRAELDEVRGRLAALEAA